MDAATDTAGKVPDQPGIDVAKKSESLFSIFSNFWGVIQNPFDLSTLEVIGQGQACLGTKTADTFFLR